MDDDKVVPTGAVHVDNVDINELVRRAQVSTEADSKLTIRQALSKYKVAVFWSMFLSTSLIMEGYDVVVVCTHLLCVMGESRTDRVFRSLPSTGNSNSRTGSAP